MKKGNKMGEGCRSLCARIWSSSGIFEILNKHVGLLLRSHVCAGVWNWLLWRISISSTDSNKWREFPLDFQQSTVQCNFSLT